MKLFSNLSQWWAKFLFEFRTANDIFVKINNNKDIVVGRYESAIDEYHSSVSLGKYEKTWVPTKVITVENSKMTFIPKKEAIDILAKKAARKRRTRKTINF